MGLDTSHNAWHGAYSAFSRWRNEVARALGYTIKRGSDGYEVADIDWGPYPLKAYEGDWLGVRKPDDPLLYLIVHSDCDGVIYPAEGKLLLPRLREALPLLDEDKSGGHIYSMRGDTQQFIDGLQAAVDANEPLEFH